MNYNEILNTNVTYPSASFEDFVRISKDCVKQFPINNSLVLKLEDGLFTVNDYQNMLLTLFHQVYYSSSSFALAGTMVDSRFTEIKDYLMEHAEEEKEHWSWIINDLKKTGYSGSDPRELFPSKEAQAYISFAMFIAHKHPVSRLAMGYVLEDLSGAYGIKYGTQIANALGLKKDAVTFTVQHGELDQGHSQDIIEVLSRANLTPYEWAHCCHTAKMTIAMYKDLYEAAFKLSGQEYAIA